MVGKVFNKILGKQTSNISNASERRKVENVYALKSIQLDRVKPLFVDELKNEIAILKVGGRTFGKKVSKLHTKGLDLISNFVRFDPINPQRHR